MTIKVRLIGVLQGLAGRSEIRVKPGKRRLTVSEAVLQLCSSTANRELERAIIDPVSRTVGSNVIVLVNDKDISVLKGPDTLIKDSDTITLVPVSHGG